MYSKGMRVKVRYTYQKSLAGEVTAVEGDVLRVLTDDSDNGWLSCRHEANGEMGLFPRDYVMSQTNHDDSFSSSDGGNGNIYDGDEESREYDNEYDDSVCYTITRDFEATLGDELSVKNGEVVIWKMENDSTKSRHNFLFVESCKVPGQKGFVPNNNLSRSTELESKPWYIGTLSREEAETLLRRAVIKNGTFIVRKSESTNGCVITVKDQTCERHYRHRKINEASGFCYAWNEIHHKTIIECIEYHSGIEDRKLDVPYNKFNPNDPSRNDYNGVHSAAASSIRPQSTVKPPTGILYGRKPPQSPQGTPENNFGQRSSQVYNSGSTSNPMSERSNSSSVDDDWYINPNKLEYKVKLGAGHYGEVWLAVYRDVVRDVAVKTLNSDTMQVNDFKKEADAMKRIRHPCLVPLLGVCNEPSYAIVTDYYRNKSIQDYLKSGNVLDLQKKLDIMKKVASGMNYLHITDLLHRDLAARNVLLDDSLNPRIADFGLAKVMNVSTNETDSKMSMPYKWTAPEAMDGKFEFSFKCDVWSYGVFGWELYTNCRTVPYPGIKSKKDLLVALKKGDRLPQPEECNFDMYQLLTSCWIEEPKNRHNFEYIIKYLNRF